MRLKSLILILIFPIVLQYVAAEPISWQIGNPSEGRGRILGIGQTIDNNWIFLGQEWNGPYLWGSLSQNSDSVEIEILPEGEYWGLAEKDGQWLTLKVPVAPEEISFDVVELKSGDSVISVPDDLVLGPFAEMDPPAEFTSFHFKLSPQSRYLFLECRLKPGVLFYDGERYVESRAVLLDLSSQTVVWETLFDSRKGPNNVRRPRFSPSYSCTFSEDEKEILIAGEETPAFIISSVNEKIVLIDPPEENIFLFSPNGSRILQYDSMARMSRFYDSETGDSLWIDSQGLRFPAFHKDGDWLVSLYDNGIDVHRLTSTGLDLIDFVPYSEILVRSEFCIVAESDIFIFSSLYSDHEIKGCRISYSDINW